jgi:thiol-disulfide isomerase/thioredoxin
MQGRDVGLVLLGGVSAVVVVALFFWISRSNQRTQLQGGSNDERKYRRLCLIKADWCPHCKRIIPVFEKLRKMHPHTFAIIDGPSQGADFLRRNRISAYPMMGVFDTRTKQITHLRVAQRSAKAIVSAAAELL